MPNMTPQLRAQLVEAYRAEADYSAWPADYLANALAKLDQLPDGPFEPTLDDFDVADEASLSPADAVALGLDFFGLPA